MPLASCLRRQLVLLPMLGVLTLPASSQTQRASHANEAPSVWPVHILVENAYSDAGVAGADISVAPVTTHAPKHLTSMGVSDDTGRFDASWPAGNYAVEVSAAGYQPVRTIIVLGPDNSVVRWGFPLYLPHGQPKEVEKAEANLQPGFCTILGYVTDAASHKPVAGAQVDILPAGSKGTTDSAGFFAIAVPTAAEQSGDAAPDRETVQISSQGYKTYSLSGLEIAQNSWALATTKLTPGKGRETHQNPTPLAETGTPADHQLDVDTVAPLPPEILAWEDGRDASPNPAEGQAPAPDKAPDIH